MTSLCKPNLWSHKLSLRIIRLKAGELGTLLGADTCGQSRFLGWAGGLENAQVQYNIELSTLNCNYSSYTASFIYTSNILVR